MSPYVITAIVLTAVGAYLTVGRHLAVQQLPTAWAKARKEWHGDNYQRASVRWQTIGMLLLWPAFMAVRLVMARLDQVIDAGDPVMLARKVAERDRRIAQLERDAGIRR